MVSDFRPLPRERCSLELRVRSKPSTCAFREDFQRTSKEFLESSSDTLPDPCHSSIPIQLLISDTLCGWSLTGHLLLEAAVGQSVRRKKNLLCSSHQNYCENNSNYSDGDVDNIHGSRKKRRTQTTDSVENSSNPRRIGKQNPPSSISGFSWKACVDEGTDCYRPDNGEYLQWKISARAQLRDGLEKQSGKTRDSSSSGDTASKSGGESQQLQEHVVEETEDAEEEEEEAGKVESDHVTHFFGFGSSRDARLQLGDVLGSRSIMEEDRGARNGRCVVGGQLRAGSLRRGGLPEERPSLPPILSQSRFSHPSISSERRRLELGMLSVEGIQLSEAHRRCEEEDVEKEDGEEEDGEEEEDSGKQTEDWSREGQEEDGLVEKEKQEQGAEEVKEEEEEKEKEEEVKENEEEEKKEEVEVKEEVYVEAEEAGEKHESESEVYDVFESNDSSMQNSGFEFERKVRDGKTEVGNESRSSEKEEETSTQLDIDFNQSPEVGQDDDDTVSSMSLKLDEGRQNLRRIMATDRLRCRNPQQDFEDRKRESLTGVLTISGICPRIGSDGSLPFSSVTASGCSSVLKNASHLDAVVHSEGIIENGSTVLERSEGKAEGGRLCLDFRRNPNDAVVHSEVIIEDQGTVLERSEEKVSRERLCLDFRRNPSDDHPSSNQPDGLPRLRVVRGHKPHRSRSPTPGPSRTDVEIAGAKVVGVTFGGQTGHVTPAKRDVAADVMTSSEEVVDTSSSCVVKKCNVIKYLTQSNCGRGFPNGFHSQPIGLHHRSRKRVESVHCSNGDVSLIISTNASIDGKLPLINGTKVQRL